VEQYDILIRGGSILDGTGSPWFKGDVAIRDGRIKKVGHVAGGARKTVDAGGMVVAPGFIDLHTHNDLTVLPFPGAESYIMQGVTTAVVGNCGLSMAPLNPDRVDLLRRYLSPFLKADCDYGWNWKSVGDYCSVVEAHGTVQNLVPLVGQGTIRLAVKGFDTTPASKAEMKAMKALLEQSMEEGCFGLSSGLIYPPGSYSTTDELVELAGSLPRYGGLYTTHMRNEGDLLMEALEEAIRIGEENGVPVEVSHHKAGGRLNWGKVCGTLRAMERARARGVEIDCDVYPYTAGSTTVTALLPGWALEGGVDKMLERVQDAKTRQTIREEAARGTTGGENWIKSAGWGGITIGECPTHHEYEGKTLEQIFRDKGKFDKPYEALFDWLVEVNGRATMILFVMDEEDVKTVIASPLSSIISDAWSTAPAAGGKPHPRAYGTFPRVLSRYVRDEKVLSLPEAIRKMTAKPASKFRLVDRGLLREGFWADVVVFNADTVRDMATFSDPHQYPEGIDYVIVNGDIAVEKGKMSGVKSGKVLRRC
jgi:N-acyl-D-amino-acid deacylase